MIDGVARSLATKALSGSSSVTGPYPGQVAQTIQQATFGPYLNIFTYLTAAQQTAVQNGTSTLDFSPILAEAITALTVNLTAGIYSGTNIIFFPPGAYTFNSTVNIKNTVVIRGCGGASQGGGQGATIFNVASNTTGFIVNRFNTLGYNTISPTTTGADGTVFMDIEFLSAGGTDPTVYGVWMRARAALIRCSVKQFPGNQINIVATAGSGGATEGNASGWVLDTVSTLGGVNGVYIQGADVNGGVSRMVNGTTHSGWGIYDGSFLGNTHLQPQYAVCGVLSYVNYLGTSYVANSTTTSTLLGSTTPGTDSTVWVATTAGTHPTWTNGGTYYPGGGYSSPGLNARSVWIGAYSEGGSPPSYCGQHSIVLGGLEGNGWGGPFVWLQNNLGSLTDGGGYTATGAVGAETLTVQFGVGTTNGDALDVTATTGFPSTFRAFNYQAANGGNLFENYANSNFNVYSILTGPNTTYNFGSTTAKPYVRYLPKLIVPDSAGTVNNGRRIWAGTSLPSTTGSAPGELTFNRTPTPAGVWAWALQTQGAPDVYFANYAYPRADPTTGIGYATGAGGTVTQITSRTTGVTINKVCGQITLVSAAGSASFQSFTVTNSTVATTDVVHVIQDSGTDLYQIFVTNVEAGTFQITYATTGGTTTEQPVFSFTVIKSVTS